MRIFLLAAVLAAVLSACASPAPPAPRSAESYFQEAETLFSEGHYAESIPLWEKVRDSYYSPELNLIVEMKIAEAYFLDEKYPEAAAAYEDFLKQHPNAGQVPDALFQLARSYYQQILSADRDQTATRNAMVTFQDLIKRFPQDPRTADAQDYIRRCRDRLADHELYVARFYLRTDRPQAAIGRLEELFQKYPRYPEQDEAWFYLGKAYLENGQRDKGVEAFNTLRSKFPASRYLADAQKALNKYYQ